MVRLEDLTQGTVVKGIVTGSTVTVIQSSWIGGNSIELTYRDQEGNTGQVLLDRDNETTLEIVEAGRPWSFDADPYLFRLASEARRILLGYLFDPMMAVHTSIVEPLPHQITAVYGEMLSRQPLRYLLADDPGAGKTIMAGLLIKELMVRGDLERCMVVCPGNLVEQWQDELFRRFHLPFEIMTNDKFEAARTGNWFAENRLVICRLDKLSRNEDVQAKLRATDWDLIVCDEAHKMSASFWGGEIKRTLRFNLGRLISTLTRHFLLLTATPHNGKEQDFQLFMSLLDGDRFEGRFRDGVHTIDVSDLMRRMIKEDLVRFDGRPLFPERRAYTVGYRLSEGEARLYQQVTQYVREEFNRAENLHNEGRRGTVGFALTVLQRRLASSPEAIYQSLRRRKERLEKRLREEELLKRGVDARFEWSDDFRTYSDLDPEDLDDAPDGEVEDIEERVVDQASAAQTIAELKAEIEILKGLENLANQVRQSGQDRKWDELSRLLQNQEEMFDSHGHRRKLIVFTEHRDTLKYLTDRIRGVMGKNEAVVNIHGGLGREERRKMEQLFIHDRDVEILVATDAAGEGINLQRAHLMVNYDLPWNPNRLEQRFGRIHRIGQTEVCHCWNLVANETREGDVYQRLLSKLETEREALGGQVFDILGQLTFEDKPLRQLLLEAIRYGDQPEVKERLNQVIDKSLDRDQLKRLIEDHALAHDTMDISKVQEIRADMERAEARRLQPHFIAAFFKEAFKRFGGVIHKRETDRYEITRVPAEVRNRDRVIGLRDSVLKRYERITFEKSLIHVDGKPMAEFICPGHPLLDATMDLVLEKHRDLLKRGAILVDKDDLGEKPKLLVYLEHAVRDGSLDARGQQRIISRQMHFVEIHTDGSGRMAGYAPFLDLRPIEPGEKEALDLDSLLADFPHGVEDMARQYAVESLVPRHFQEVKKQRLELVEKTRRAVKARLTAEIAHWDHRAEELKLQEAAGRPNARINSQLARQRANDLSDRLKKRMDELERQKQLQNAPPLVSGGVLVIPQGLLNQLNGQPGSSTEATAEERKRIELKAMQAVMTMETALGNQPRDVSAQNLGYDIESICPENGRLRFIEVKGRVASADTVTITKNEILIALNQPEQYFLALVLVDGEETNARYIVKPFGTEPDFGVTSVNYKIRELWDRSFNPREKNENQRNQS